MSTIRYISLFSGIEAATVAWHQLGWNQSHTRKSNHSQKPCSDNTIRKCQI